MPIGFLAENGYVVLTALVLVLSGGGVLYAVQFRALRRGNDRAPADSLRETGAGQNRIALVVPEGASIDSLATAVGLQAL